MGIVEVGVRVEKIGSENQAVKKPRFRGGSGAAEVLCRKGILDTLVSQPASGEAWLKAIDGSLEEQSAVIPAHRHQRRTCP